MSHSNIAEEMKAREHNLVEDAAEATAAGVGVGDVLKGIEVVVVDTYQTIEDGVVGTYKKVEDAVVGAYQAVEDRFVDTFLAQEGETTEEAKARINGKK